MVSLGEIWDDIVRASDATDEYVLGVRGSEIMGGAIGGVFGREGNPASPPNPPQNPNPHPDAEKQRQEADKNAFKEQARSLGLAVGEQGENLDKFVNDACRQYEDKVGKGEPPLTWVDATKQLKKYEEEITLKKYAEAVKGPGPDKAGAEADARTNQIAGLMAKDIKKNLENISLAPKIYEMAREQALKEMREDAGELNKLRMSAEGRYEVEHAEELSKLSAVDRIKQVAAAGDAAIKPYVDRLSEASKTGATTDERNSNRAAALEGIREQTSKNNGVVIGEAITAYVAEAQGITREEAIKQLNDPASEAKKLVNQKMPEMMEKHGRAASEEELIDAFNKERDLLQKIRAEARREAINEDKKTGTTHTEAELKAIEQAKLNDIRDKSLEQKEAYYNTYKAENDRKYGEIKKPQQPDQTKPDAPTPDPNKPGTQPDPDKPNNPAPNNPGKPSSAWEDFLKQIVEIFKSLFEGLGKLFGGFGGGPSGPGANPQVQNPNGRPQPGSQLTQEQQQQLQQRQQVMAIEQGLMPEQNQNAKTLGFTLRNGQKETAIGSLKAQNELLQRGINQLGALKDNPDAAAEIQRLQKEQQKNTTTADRLNGMSTPQLQQLSNDFYAVAHANRNRNGIDNIGAGAQYIVNTQSAKAAADRTAKSNDIKPAAMVRVTPPSLPNIGESSPEIGVS